MFWIEAFAVFAVLVVISIVMLIDSYWEDG